MPQNIQPVILIPARLAATRFPRKPLALIKGKPMILHVIERSLESGIKDICVACGDQEIWDVVTKAGFQAIMTDPDLPSGSDRVYHALQEIDPQQRFNIVVNLQGDLPVFDATLVTDLVDLFTNEAIDISTPVTPFKPEEDPQNPNKVKAVVTWAQNRNIQEGSHGKALYFSRASVPWGAETFYHHLGIYVYRRSTLETFMNTTPTSLELTEKLEQLRALDLNMHIEALLTHKQMLSVDTPEDLLEVEKHLRSS